VAHPAKDGSYAPHGTNASPLPPPKNDIFLYPLKKLFRNVPVLFLAFSLVG
jgi:hypothetical protein